MALLTARILAPGEDSGMLQNSSGPTNLLLPLFWFLAAVGLAGWRVWSRRGEWRGGLVEAALLAAALLVFVAAETAAYKHPARLIAWDWLTLFLVVCLVRQLAASAEDQQSLFAVFLAGAASLSAQAVYQAILRAPASATFAQPGPFAAWLALFLPGLLAAAVVCRFRRTGRWQTLLAEVFALLGMVAFIAALASAFNTSDAHSLPLPDLWRATGKMIAAKPFGVGPANFSRALPRFQEPGAGAIVADPHNFVLEVAATCGSAVLLAVLIALGAFFVQALRWLFRKPAEPTEAAAEPEVSGPTRWEYYFGGMVGLVLGFIIRQTTGEHTPDETFVEGLIACVRCLVWLTAFVVFEHAPWTGRVRVAALVVGVAALLGVLTASPGAGLPSVAVPLWAAVALALNGMPQRDYPRINKLALTRVVPLAVMALVTLLYFWDIFVPVTGCSDKIQQALREGRRYHNGAGEKDPFDFVAREVLRPLADAAQDDADDARVRVLQAAWTGELWSLQQGGEVGAKLATGAVRHAGQAERLDPQGRDGYAADYHLRMEFGRRLETAYQTQGSRAVPSLAAAVGPGYRLFLNETRWPNPLGRGAIDTLKQKYRQAIKAGKAEEINPYEPAIQYMEAADVLEKYLPNDPNDPELRYRLAATLFKAWEDARCRDQAAEALRLDAASARPPLTDEQRQKLKVWKDLPPPG